MVTGTMGAQLSELWGAHEPNGLAGILLWLARSTPLGRGRLRKLTFQAFSALHPGPVDTRVFETRVRLHPSNNVVERKALLRPERMDPRERAKLRRGMSVPGAVFIDIGANAGLYSLDAALHAGAGGHIVAIEPNEQLLNRLVFNIEIARRDGHILPSVVVTRLALAASDHDGVALLGASRSEGGRSLLDLETDMAGAANEVPVRTLAGLVAELGLSRIDVLKIDVEGHEDRIWPPFLDTVAPNLRPRVLIIEHLARAEWKVDCIALAETACYTTLFTTNNNTVLEKSD